MTAPPTVFVACAMPAASSPANATPPAFASIFDASVAVSATGPGALTTAPPDTWASTVLVIVLVEIEPPPANSPAPAPPRLRRETTFAELAAIVTAPADERTSDPEPST